MLVKYCLLGVRRLDAALFSLTVDQGQSGGQPHSKEASIRRVMILQTTLRPRDSPLVQVAFNWDTNWEKFRIE